MQLIQNKRDSCLIIPCFLYKAVDSGHQSSSYYKYSVQMPRNDKEAATIVVIMVIILALAISITLAITLSGPFTKYTSDTSSQDVAMDIVSNTVLQFNTSQSLTQA
ncbi:hypothetical protein PS15m_004930 [Mucor circinelloides]